MPSLNRTEDRRTPADAALDDALRRLRDEDDPIVPPHIQASVMRAWDARTRRQAHAAGLVHHAASADARHHRPFRVVAVVAACLLLAVAAGTWRSATTNVAGNPALAAGGIDASSIDMRRNAVAALSSADLLLGDDPASMQVVRLSVSPAMLAVFGYPLLDPADTEPVAVDMLLGADGVPRVIRVQSGLSQE